MFRGAAMSSAIASLAVPLALFLAVGLLLAAAVSDLAFRLVPNWLPALLAVDGAALRLADGTLLTGAAAALAVFAGCVLLWRFRLMGGGDVKLFGAAALAVPLPASFVATAVLAGGLLALLYLLLRRVVPRPAAARPCGLLRRTLRMEQHRIRTGHSLPYCCAIAFGAAATLIGG